MVTSRIKRTGLVASAAVLALSSWFFPIRVLSTQSESSAKAPCVPRATDDGMVCVCNSTYCDTYDIDGWSNLDPDLAYVTTSSRGGDRMKMNIYQRMSGASAAPTPSPSGRTVVITLDTTGKQQTMKGFGGALTDSAIENLKLLKPETRQTVLDAYFSPKGLRYSIIRVPIASNDFSRGNYSYQDSPADDFELKNFSIAMDKVDKVPLIQSIERQYGKMKLFASMWAPPSWMCKGGTVVDCQLKGNYADSPYVKALGLYYSKFLSAYAEENITFWAVTAQNEPHKQNLSVGQGWESLRMTANEHRDFIKNSLGPQLEKDHPKVEIIMLDDQRDLLPEWADVVLSDPEAEKYVAGIGVHWYSSVGLIVGPYFSNLNQTKAKYPRQYIMATEQCEGYLPFPTERGVRLGSWERGEKYLRDIMGTVMNSGVGWVDWNIVLDLKGGPNWAKNVVDSPIIADVDGKEEYYKQPMYYALGHFSRFVPPDSVKIQSTVRLGSSVLEGKNSDKVQVVGFTTPKGYTAVIMLNRAEETKDVTIEGAAKAGVSFAFEVPGKSFTSILINPGASGPQMGEDVGKSGGQSVQSSWSCLLTGTAIIFVGMVLS